MRQVDTLENKARCGDFNWRATTCTSSPFNSETSKSASGIGCTFSTKIRCAMSSLSKIILRVGSPFCWRTVSRWRTTHVSYFNDVLPLTVEWGTNALSIVMSGTQQVEMAPLCFRRSFSMLHSVSAKVVNPYLSLLPLIRLHCIFSWPDSALTLLHFCCTPLRACFRDRSRQVLLPSRPLTR